MPICRHCREAADRPGFVYCSVCERRATVYSTAPPARGSVGRRAQEQADWDALPRLDARPPHRARPVRRLPVPTPTPRKLEPATMSDDNGGRRRVDNTRFKWIVVASLIALAMILGTLQELIK